eukprot:6088802-Amphidinium_carterae.1
MDGVYACARSAWYETCQQQNCLMLASCVLLPLYSNALLLACTVVADHFRFHVVGLRVPLEPQLVAFSHLWFYLSAARFHDRHVTHDLIRMAHPPKEAGFILWHHGSSRAVPGFLQVSDLSQWVLSNAVALFSGLTV